MDLFLKGHGDSRWFKTVLGSHFGVGEFTHFRTYSSGAWAVHWGYDLGVDPWPSRALSIPWQGIVSTRLAELIPRKGTCSTPPAQNSTDLKVDYISEKAC